MKPSHLIRRLLFITLLALALAPVQAQQPSQPAPPPDQQQPPGDQTPRWQPPRRTQLPEDVEIIRDIEYGRVGNKPLLLDIGRPKRPPAGAVPTIVWIHGGAWRSGSKESAPHAILVPHGYVVASINYRLSGEARFPAAIEDCKCAVRWLRANAEKYGVDPGRIGVWGSSAGGHLALLVGVADEQAKLEGRGGHLEYSSRVQAVCSYFGPADLTLRPERFEAAIGGALAQFLGGTFKEKPAEYKRASPTAYVTPDDPPVLMVHGERDSIVPLEQSVAMLEALKKAEVPVELLVVKNAQHGFFPVGGPISPTREEITRKTLEFFDKYLKSAKTEKQMPQIKE